MTQRYRPICWYCNRPIHPLDDMHHYWCHGGSMSATGDAK